MTDSVRSNTRYVTDLDREDQAKLSRAKKYRLQDTARRLLPSMRVGWCMHRIAKIDVGIMQYPKTGKAFYEGLSTCGQVWVCPICASRISEKRRIELEDAVKKSGLTPVLVTVTLQHSLADKLSGLVRELTEGLRKLKMGGWWTRWKEKYNVKAYVSSLETPWGKENGWHPHKHWLLFLDLPENQVDAEQLKAELTERWSSLMAKNGRYTSDLYAINVQVGNKAAASYTAKWGLASEVTKAVVKNGKTGLLSPWQLLDLASQGDLQAGALFIEYALATAGLKQLQWSHKGRQALGLSRVEKSDADLAKEPAADETGQTPDQDQPVQVCRINSEEWDMVVKDNGRLLLLEITEGLGVEGVNMYIEGLWQKYRKKEGDNGHGEGC